MDPGVTGPVWCRNMRDTEAPHHHGEGSAVFCIHKVEQDVVGGCLPPLDVVVAPAAGGQRRQAACAAPAGRRCGVVVVVVGLLLLLLLLLLAVCGACGVGCDAGVGAARGRPCGRGSGGVVERAVDGVRGAVCACKGLQGLGRWERGTVLLVEVGVLWVVVGLVL